MSKFSKFIKDIVLPDKVDKERRKKILSEGIIETWQSEEQDRKAKEIAKEAYKTVRSSKDDKEHSHPTEHDESDDLEMVKAIKEKE
jgi:hypothetical protein|tara:strand:- start:871 stop:1128 length:258 start_codon:yes stop_codon:yes gene_type:complete